jgi:putative transposase
MFPPSERQRCLAHRMRNLAAKVPTDPWPEFKTRVTLDSAIGTLVAEPRAAGGSRERLQGVHRSKFGTLL